MHLPTWDFRAYKVGANIQDGMITPEDAAVAVIEYEWKFSVNGEEKIITTNGSYPNVDGEYIGVETKVIEEGYDPPIKDFSIEREDENLTDSFLDKNNLIIVVSYNLESAEADGVSRLKKTTDEAISKGYTVIGLTASGITEKENINSKNDLNFDWYLCDEKALKTVIRANPGIVKLHKGTVTQKVHWNDIQDLDLPEVEREVEPIKEDEDSVLYLIDNVISTKEEVGEIAPDRIEEVFVSKDDNAVKLLDSINAANNSSFTAYINFLLKKE